MPHYAGQLWFLIALVQSAHQVHQAILVGEVMYPVLPICCLDHGLVNQECIGHHQRSTSLDVHPLQTHQNTLYNTRFVSPYTTLLVARSL